MPLVEQLENLDSTASEKESFGAHIKLWIPVAVVIGIVVGLAMSLFLIFTVFVHELLDVFHPLIMMAIGSIAVLLLVKLGFEDPNENGIAYVIRRKHERQAVPIRQTQEFVSSGITIGSGLPVGREGPALIIGSAIASKISQWRNVDDRFVHEAITIGSAAATGALFQAPFGSAVFATEVPYKEDSDEPMLMVSFLASVFAAVTLKSVINMFSTHVFEINLHLFRLGNAEMQINIANSLLAILLGILIGLLGRMIIYVFYIYQNYVVNKFNEITRLILASVLCISAIFVGLIIVSDLYLAQGIWSFDAISGYIGSQRNNLMVVLFVALVVQIVATVAIIGAGFPGGIFSPSLAIGALSGLIFANILSITPVVNITAWAIIGMSAFHAASTKTPIASILLVLEITNLPNLIIPIILANISAYIISGHKSLYAGQARSRDAQLLSQLSQYDQLSDITIEQVMTPRKNVITATPDLTLTEMKAIATSANKRTFPVIEDTKVVGIVSYKDILTGEYQELEVVRDVMVTKVVTVEKDMTARQAMYKILQEDVERVPVVNSNNELTGIVTINDILRGHQKFVSQNQYYEKQRLRFARS